MQTLLELQQDHRRRRSPKDALDQQACRSARIQQQGQSVPVVRQIDRASCPPTFAADLLHRQRQGRGQAPARQRSLGRQTKRSNTVRS